MLFFIPEIANSKAASPTTKTAVKTKSPTTTTSISSNPAAVNLVTGTGAAQQYIEKKLGIKNNHGISIKGGWVGDTNQLLAGGKENPQRNTSNSLLLLNLTVDMNELNHWKGGLFGAEFLQLNAQNTNAQANSFPGYNSLPGPPPLNRSQLYQLWLRQELFDKKLIVRVGKTAPTLDFNNVVKPVPLHKAGPDIPAVTGLIYTPIFINPTMIGVMPGFYNSAFGITVNVAPIKAWYLSYGVYDGNLASGKQTGLTGPTFNGAYFHVGETGAAWLLGKNQLPGNIGVGVWHQNGLISAQFLPLLERRASGAYLFGTQRLWYKDPGYSSSGISAFYQYGINNSIALPVKKYVGAGLTAFGLIPSRPDDSIGIGKALSWVNQAVFNNARESMYQLYYQAKIVNGVYFEPVLTYIPSPAETLRHNTSWAGTARIIALF